MNSPSSIIDQDSIRQRIHALGHDPKDTYYAWIEGSSVMLLNGPLRSDPPIIQNIVLPSAMQIAYLVSTASDAERRDAAREHIAKMFSFLTESEGRLKRIEEDEATRRFASVSPPDSLRECGCYQYQLTGDCYCTDFCKDIGGCRFCQ